MHVCGMLAPDTCRGVYRTNTRIAAARAAPAKQPAQGMEQWDGRSTISVLTFMSQYVIGQTVWLPAPGGLTRQEIATAL
jgi:hypothetical protein